METINAIGRRKASVARVYVSNGTGKIKINGREYKEYFPQLHISAHVIAPLLELDVLNQYDICLLYTSDAADERSSVDLGGRRIITQKNKTKKNRKKIKKKQKKQQHIR